MAGLSGYPPTTARAPQGSARPVPSTARIHAGHEPVRPAPAMPRVSARGSVRSVRQALARGGREHVGLARPRHDVQLRALLRDLTAVDADHEVLGLAVDLGG